MLPRTDLRSFSTGARPAVCALLTACVLLAAAPAVSAQPAAAAAVADLDRHAAIAEIDQLFRDAYPLDQPGAAVIVVDDGEVLLREGYGSADLELGVPVAPDMVFRIGSITKQFTAAAILMLAAEGEIDLDAEITEYLPDYPTHGATITIHHLLNHTSGIPSYTGLEEWRPLMREDKSVEEMIDLFEELPLEFPPGSRFSYNNSAYFLLGAVIEAVSGESYADFIERRIFDPLWMNDSYYGDPQKLIPRRAKGYEGSADAPTNASYLSMTQPYAAGSLLSTVDDLARWDAALYTDRLLPEEWRDKLWTPTSLDDGSSTGYGYGLAIWDYAGHTVVEHGGGINGYVCNGVRLPEHGIYVAVLTNRSGGGGANHRMLSLKAATLVLGEPIHRRPTIEMSVEELGEYVGVYRIDEEDQRVISLEDGKLFSQRSGSIKTEMLPIAPDRFAYSESTSVATFERENGEITGMLMDAGFGPDEPSEKISDQVPEERQVAEVDPAVYDDYVGEYEIAPSFILTVTRDGDRLITQATGQQAFEVFPSSETEFFLKEVDAQLTFVRGDDGTVTQLILHQGGRDIPAKRIE